MSLYLDAMRFFAAMVVLASHLAYDRFTDGRIGWVRDLNLGSDAVVLFFVMSGFIIARAATRPGVTGPGFVFDRVSRLLSVALPVLLATFAIDLWAQPRAPAFYDGPFFDAQPLWRMLLLGLSFSNEWSFAGVRLGSNGPFWSLSYEAAFYGLFAAAIFLRGARRVAVLLAGCIVVGPNVLLLLPAWLMGVLSWRQSGRRLSILGAGLAAVLPIIGYALALYLGVPQALLNLTENVVGSAGLVDLRFSANAAWNTLLAVGIAVHLAAMMRILELLPAREMPWVRWLAGGSFSLYLLHYPVLQALGAHLPKMSDPVLRDMTLAAITIFACYAFAGLFERTLPAQRRAIRAVLQDKEKAAPVRSGP